MICVKCGLSDRYGNGKCKPCNRAKVRAWSAENAERKKASTKVWQLANAKSKSEKERLRRLANKEKESANKKAWATKNAEKKRAYDLAWQKANPDRCKSNRIAWESKNPEKVRSKDAMRRIRKCAKDSEKFDPFEVFERDEWKCYLCGQQTLKSKRGTTHNLAPELDHIIPLSRGGPHTRANSACSCRGCNGKKGSKVISM